jgi:3-isopropylmalate/(R)-2-methylmalate dehydratase large subunit
VPSWTWCSANDITSPVAINEFEKAGFDHVFDKSKVVMIMDHFTPNKDIKAATQCKQCRTFARRFDLDHYYDVGEMGIEHALVPEKGLIAPARPASALTPTPAPMVLWALSPPAWAPRIWAPPWQWVETWFKVPAAIKINLPAA